MNHVVFFLLVCVALATTAPQYNTGYQGDQQTPMRQRTSVNGPSTGNGQAIGGSIHTDTQGGGPAPQYDTGDQGDQRLNAKPMGHRTVVTGPSTGNGEAIGGRISSEACVCDGTK